MNLEVLFRDVKLSLADVSLVLLVRVADVAAFCTGLDLGTVDAENLHTIGKEQPIVEYIELPPLHLLDIAVEPVVPPTGKQHRLSLGDRVFAALKYRFVRHRASGFLLHG